MCVEQVISREVYERKVKNPSMRLLSRCNDTVTYVSSRSQKGTAMISLESQTQLCHIGCCCDGVPLMASLGSETIIEAVFWMSVCLAFPSFFLELVKLVIGCVVEHDKLM